MNGRAALGASYSGKGKDCWQEVALGLDLIAEFNVRKEFG
jgi:hypothetical protein